MITSKADRDKVRQKGATRKRILDAAIKAVREFEQGRALNECFSDLRKVVRDAKI